MDILERVSGDTMPRAKSMYLLLVVAFLLSCSCVTVEAGPKKRNQRSSHLDKDVKQRRTECDSIVMTLGTSCTQSSIARENCILKCISETCYAETYGHDALEEGEVDTVRGRAFRACSRTDLKRRKDEAKKTISSEAAGQVQSN